MTIFEAVTIAEGNIDLASEPIVAEFHDDPESVTLEAWQLLVSSGVAWQLQGYFGRQAAALIDAGLISDRRAA